MNRLLALLVSVCLFSGACSHLGWAQDASSPTQWKTERWEVGTAAHFISVHGVPGLRVEGQVSRQFADHWGLQAAVRYAFADESGKPSSGARLHRRQVEGALSLFWQPFTFRTGPLDHSMRIQAGPAIQGGRNHWKGRILFCATGLTEKQIEAFNNRYPPTSSFANVGVDVGISYGLSYRAITVRFLLRGGKRLASLYRSSSHRRAEWMVGRGVGLSVRL